MELIRAVTVVVFLVIYGTNLGSAGFLPQLRGNRLSEGKDRDLPNGIPIHCGDPKPPVQVTVKSTKLPSEVLGSYFERYPFSSSPIGFVKAPKPGREANFKFAVLKASSYYYALEVDEIGESGYWLPQGGTIDIPGTPADYEPKYVFTPDFSGCSWTVTPLANGGLRLRHVEGGKEAEQFNNLSDDVNGKGGDVTYAMEYKDYSYIVETHRLVSNVPAYAYMHFSGGRWKLYVQTLACGPQPGGYVFNDGLLSKMVLCESKSNYNTVYKVRVYDIPNTA